MIAMRRTTISAIARAVVGLGATAIFAFPTYWLVITSLKQPGEVIRDPPVFLPTSVDFAAYARAFAGRGADALLDSLIVAATVSGIATALGALAGYALARYRLGGLHLPLAILAVRMLPPVAFIVPLFLAASFVGLVDTHAAVVATHLIVTLPFAVWVMRQAVLAVPVEFEEAALMDGSTRLQLLGRVVLPLTAPWLAVTALFSFIFSWNEFLFALVLSRRQVTTVPVAIAGTLGDGPAGAAIAVVSLLPLVLLAVVAQRTLGRGGARS